MCATPTTVEALALRDSAPQIQGRVRVAQVATFYGRPPGRMTPHPSRGKRVSHFNDQ